MTTSALANQYFAAFSCHLSSLMMGCGFGWITPIMVPLLNKELGFEMTYSQISLAVSIVELGILISPMPAGILANRWGRKPWLLVTAWVMLVSWLALAVTDSVAVIFVVRVLMGIAAGIILTLNPTYVAEISDPSHRGQLCGHFKTIGNLGNLYVYCLGPYLPYRIYIYACMLPCVLFFVTFLFAPETPYFLLMKEKNASALKSLKWLRGTENVDEEYQSVLESIVQDRRKKNNSIVELFTNRQSLKALFILLLVMLVRFGGGTAAVITYSTKTLSESVTVVKPELVTIGIGLVLTVSNCVGSGLSDSIGRKPLLLTSTLGLVVFNLLIFTYYYLERVQGYDMLGYDWILYISLVGYFVFTNIGIGTLLPTLQAEYFPSSTRGVAGAFITCVGTFLVFGSLIMYQVVEETYGVHVNFLSYAIMCLIGFVGLVIMMKETANTSLADVK